MLHVAQFRLLKHHYFVGGQKVEVKSKKEPTDQDSSVEDSGGVKQRIKTTDSPRPKPVSVPAL